MSQLPVDPVYAVLSAMAYENGRDRANLLSALRPGGAVQITVPGLGSFRDDLTGFEASAFVYNGQVVIAYAGTVVSQRLS
jgi:hypothetical protein